MFQGSFSVDTEHAAHGSAESDRIGDRHQAIGFLKPSASIHNIRVHRR
jgi:hypothetical protein